MPRKIIDLSIYLENDVISDPPPFGPKITYMDHQSTFAQVLDRPAGNAEAGKPFDPREHEAIVNVPGTGRAEGEIVEVIRRGYKLRDRVLRPALVAVAAAPDPGAAGDPAARPN